MHRILTRTFGCFVMSFTLLFSFCERTTEEVAGVDALVAVGSKVAIDVFGAPTAGLGGIITGAAQALALVINHNIGDIVSITNANGDPDFSNIATVPPTVITPISEGTTVPTQLAIDTNDFLVATGQTLDNVRLIRLSLKKYYGALNAGNTAKIELQKTAVCEFVGRFDRALQGVHNSLVNISADLQSIPLASVSVSAVDVLTLRNQIVSSGRFPDFEASILAEAHATPEEIAGALGRLSRVTESSLNQLSDTDRTAIGVINGLVRVTDRVSAQAFLPSDFNCTASACSTICFRPPEFFLLNSPYLPPGTTVIINGANINAGTNNVVQIKLNLGVTSNGPLSARQQLNRQFVAAQLSLINARGHSSPAAFTALASPLSCYGFTSTYVLSTGEIISSSTTLAGLFSQVQSMFNSRSITDADMEIAAHLFVRLSSNNRYGCTGTIVTSTYCCHGALTKQTFYDEISNCKAINDNPTEINACAMAGNTKLGCTGETFTGSTIRTCIVR